MKNTSILSSLALAIGLSSAALADNIQMTIMSVDNIAHMDFGGGSDPYVKWSTGEMSGQTRVISIKKADRRAEFNYEDAFDTKEAKNGEIIFSVKEQDSGFSLKKMANLMHARSYGSAKVTLSAIPFDGKDTVVMNLPITGDHAKDEEGRATTLKVRFTKISDKEYIEILKNRKR